MVILVVNDVNQICMLEDALLRTNLSYVVEAATEAECMQAPFLIVDGVPLNEETAFKYIKEYEVDD